MKRLYIIGNGFDLHHDLKTSYIAFGLFLEKKYGEIYDHLIEHYGLPPISDSSDNTLWSEFEDSLALLDVDSVLEAYQDYLADPGSSTFRDRDWGAFGIEIKRVTENLTVRLLAAFKEFILSVEYPKNIGETILSIDRDATFLSFNYTDTLECFYKVKKENILYIHSKASEDNDEDLILGHGYDPSEFEVPDVEPPENLSERERELWKEDMNDNYNLSFEQGKHEISDYFSDTFKNTDAIICDNIHFFESLNSVDEIFVLGHSMSSVDIPYFEFVKSRVKENTRWTASYYDSSEEKRHLDTLLELNIDKEQIKLIRIEDIQ